MIKVGILGATGYAGIEVVRLLTAHPEGFRKVLWGRKSRMFIRI